LTGAYNRRGFLHMAGHHLRIARRFSLPASLVVVEFQGVSGSREASDLALIRATEVARIIFPERLPHRTYRSSELGPARHRHESPGGTGMRGLPSLRSWRCAGRSIRSAPPVNPNRPSRRRWNRRSDHQ
jgi:hypothetical protein